MFKDISVPANRQPTNVHGELLNMENKRLNNELLDYRRESKSEFSPVFKQSGKPIKRLSFRNQRDKRTHPQKAGNIHRAEKTGRKPDNRGKIQQRRKSRHLLIKRVCSGSSELRERKNLRLERLSSASDKNKSLEHREASL